MTRDCYFPRMLFSSLAIWDDDQPRSPSAQMAADEALLSLAPAFRLYRWTSPAVTFGYAQRHADVLPLANGRPLVRRWTGGGVVFHGTDLTLALAVPPDHSLAAEKTGHIYFKIHEAILSALREKLPSARLATPSDCRPGAACFTSPALHDILDGPLKICGGALRRGKRGVLYQGSLHASLSADDLGRSLSASWTPLRPDADTESLVHRHEQTRYAMADWNLLR